MIMSRGPRRNGGCSTIFWILVIVFGLIGYAVNNVGGLFQCDHNWEPATCTTPKTCSKCKQTQGKTLEHNLTEVPCGEAAECLDCGATEVRHADHEWIRDTCFNCGTVREHDLVLNDCNIGYECTRCSHREGAKPHDYAPATCESPETCTVCGKTQGEANGHKYTLDTCGASLVCLSCEQVPSDVPAEVHGHTFAEQDTGSHRRCTECGTSVEILFARSNPEAIRVYTEYPNDGSAPYTTYFDGNDVYSAQWKEEDGIMVLRNSFGGKPAPYCVNGKVYFDLYGYEAPDRIEESLATTASGYVYFTQYIWSEDKTDGTFGGSISLHTDPKGNGYFFEFEDEGWVYLVMDVDGVPYAIIYKGENQRKPEAVYVTRLYTELIPEA